eukprot:246519_1
MGTHIYWRSSVKTLHYITLELYDYNGDEYLVWFNGYIHEYVLNNNNISPLYDTAKNQASLNTLISGVQTNIGERFKILYKQINSKTISVDMIIDGVCELTFYMYMSNSRIHKLVIKPPTCYKCHVCGLCGDFKTKPTSSKWKRLESVTGQIVKYRTGCCGSKFKELYDKRGWGCEKKYVDSILRRRRLQNINDSYSIDAGDNFTYVHPCNESVDAKAIQQCQLARRANHTVHACQSVGDSFCDDLQETCAIDVCEASALNISSVENNVQELFVDIIDFIVNTTDITHLFNLTNNTKYITIEQCMDYQNHAPDDGNYLNLNDEITKFQNSISIPNENGLIMKYFSNKFASTIECNRDHAAQICFIECYGANSCSRISINNHNVIQNLKQIDIMCIGYHSCQSMHFDMIDSYVGNVTIFCQQSLSCNLMKIDISATQPLNLSLFCIDVSSCNGVNIDLVNSYQNDVYTNIVCNTESSCNDMFISVNDGAYINMKFEMYKYSKNVQMKNIHYDSINVICSANETQTIKYYYNKSEELNQTKLYKLSRNAYSPSQKLPCEGITIIKCDTNEDTNCTMKYMLNESIILSQLDETNCYLFDVNNIYQPIWNCIDNIDTDICDENEKNNGRTTISQKTIITICLIIVGFIVLIMIIFVVCKCVQKDEQQIGKIPQTVDNSVSRNQTVESKEFVE